MVLIPLPMELRRLSMRELLSSPQKLLERSGASTHPHTDLPRSTRRVVPPFRPTVMTMAAHARSSLVLQSTQKDMTARLKRRSVRRRNPARTPKTLRKTDRVARKLGETRRSRRSLYRSLGRKPHNKRKLATLCRVLMRRGRYRVVDGDRARSGGQVLAMACRGDGKVPQVH